MLHPPLVDRPSRGSLRRSRLHNAPACRWDKLARQRRVGPVGGLPSSFPSLLARAKPARTRPCLVHRQQTNLCSLGTLNLRAMPNFQQDIMKRTHSE
jgi:hypothetical protein